MTDKHRRDLDSVKRLAEWLEPWGKRWGCRAAVRQQGPVIELELGYRPAAYFLHAPSSGTWRDLGMSK